MSLLARLTSVGTASGGQQRSAPGMEDKNLNYF
jgi:hypothetical protein